MNTLRVLAAATFALTATGAAPSFALSPSAAHGQAAYRGGGGRVDFSGGRAGRSRFRDVDRSPFDGETGDWGFAHARGDEARGLDGWRRHGRGRHRVYDFDYPYAGDYSYGTGAYEAGGLEDAYAGEYGAGDFEPQQPYGEGFYGRQAPVARPMASALAPLAYGPGPHDGAYAYGYNGHAQTPRLFDTTGSSDWMAYREARRPCGC